MYLVIEAAGRNVAVYLVGVCASIPCVFLNALHTYVCCVMCAFSAYLQYDGLWLY